MTVEVYFGLYVVTLGGTEKLKIHLVLSLLPKIKISLRCWVGCDIYIASCRWLRCAVSCVLLSLVVLLGGGGGVESVISHIRCGGVRG